MESSQYENLNNLSCKVSFSASPYVYFPRQTDIHLNQVVNLLIYDNKSTTTDNDKRLHLISLSPPTRANFHKPNNKPITTDKGKLPDTYFQD